MKILKKFLVLTTAIGVLALVNVSVQSFNGNGNDTKVSQSLEQQIYKSLLGLPRYGVFDHISFQISNGNVTLEGKVYSQGTRGTAESVVKRIPGVVSVANNIENLPPSPYDDQIRREVLRTFHAKGLSRYFSEVNPEVRIIVDNGRITLEGYVANSSDRNVLNIYANGVSGVFNVQNSLIVGKRVR